MRIQLTAYLAGLVFGLGLLVSGMANPAKVLNFLDLAVDWDPSLALVMAGAIGVAWFGFWRAGTLRRSLWGAPMQLPGARGIDRRLVFGSLTFGIGWGIAGICPGPALVLLGTGSVKGLLFVVSMLAGMILFRILERRKGV